MRKFLVVLLALAAACGPKPVNTGTTGADSPRAAVDAFLMAARAGDLQAMSGVWGTEKGPVRESLDPAELERRELIMICHFKADQYRVLSEGPAERGERVLRVSLTKGGVTRESSFWTIRGPAERWYVVNADVAPVKDFCKG